MPISSVSQPSGSIGSPLLVFLHGAGETGGDPEFQVKKSGPWRTSHLAYHPDVSFELARFDVLGLHLSDGQWDPNELNNCIEGYLDAHEKIDRDNLCLTGLSRGGRGVLRLAIHRLRAQQHVSAIAAFCPEGGIEGYSEEDLILLRRVPIYIFHCPDDPTVPFEGSAELQSRIGSATCRLRTVLMTELEDKRFAHDCWTLAYGHPALYRWLLRRSKDSAEWPSMKLPYVPGLEG